MHIAKWKRMVAVYEAGSFRRAAQELGMSQPALTWSIRQLEDDLNVRLFERGPRGIEPTAMCEKLISRARLISREQDRIMAEVERDSRNQTIAIGVHSGMMNGAFARCITSFANVAPDVILRIREGYSAELIESLQRGELDFGYCTLPAGMESDDILQIDPVTTLDYSLVARPDHPIFEDMAAGREPGRHPWAIFEPHKSVGAFAGTGDLDAVLEKAGFPRAIQEVRTASMNMIQLLVTEGGHIGLIADEFIDATLRAGRVKRLPHARISTAQMGFVSVRGCYETPLIWKLKGMLRRCVMDA